MIASNAVNTAIMLVKALIEAGAYTKYTDPAATVAKQVKELADELAKLPG